MNEVKVSLTELNTFLAIIMELRMNNAEWQKVNQGVQVLQNHIAKNNQPVAVEDTDKEEAAR